MVTMKYEHGYVVIDFMGEPLRWFEHRDEAKYFIENKPDCKLVKQTINWDNYEECLF